MEKDSVSSENLLAIAFVAMLSPGVRMIPRLSAAAAGKAAWLSVLPAAIGGTLLALFLRRIQKTSGEGKGIPDLMLEAFDPRLGKLLLEICGMWFAFYCGFVLNASAERLVSTIYIEDGKALFIGACASCGFLASNRGMKSVGRFCRIGGAGVLAVILTTAVLGAGNIKTEWVFPVRGTELRSVIEGSAPVIDCLMLIPTLGYLGEMSTKEIRTESSIKTVLKTVLCLGALVFVTIGALSAPVTAKLENPYFVMVRDIKVTDIIERIEAVVVGVWVITDYIMVSLMITISSHLWSRAAGRKRSDKSTAFAAVISALIAFSLPEGEEIRKNLSDKWVPIGYCLTVIVIPSITLIKNRKNKKTICSKKKKEKGQILI